MAVRMRIQVPCMSWYSATVVRPARACQRRLFFRAGSPTESDSGTLHMKSGTGINPASDQNLGYWLVLALIRPQGMASPRAGSMVPHVRYERLANL
jgi:hypothetical protein